MSKSHTKESCSQEKGAFRHEDENQESDLENTRVVGQIGEQEETILVDYLHGLDVDESPTIRIESSPTKPVGEVKLLAELIEFKSDEKEIQPAPKTLELEFGAVVDANG